MIETVKTGCNVDTKHYKISFKVKQMMIPTVSCHFKELSATMETDNDFFNTMTYSEIIFKSTYFDGNTLKGDLTIGGVVKKIKLDVHFDGVEEESYGKTMADFEKTGEINRKDFDLIWNDRD